MLAWKEMQAKKDGKISACEKRTQLLGLTYT